MLTPGLLFNPRRDIEFAEQYGGILGMLKHTVRGSMAGALAGAATAYALSTSGNIDDTTIMISALAGMVLDHEQVCVQMHIYPNRVNTLLPKKKSSD